MIIHIGSKKVCLKTYQMRCFTLSFLLLTMNWLQQANAQGAILLNYLVTDCNLPKKEIHHLAIQQVTLQDTILIKEIRVLMEEEKNTSEMFKKGYGFVQVMPDHDLEENILRSYYIDIDYTALKTRDREPKYYLAYPDNYAFLDGRLVFIYLRMTDGMICKRFTKRSMARLRKIQNRHLEKTKKVTAYDMDGNPVFTDRHFRIDYSKLHGGRYIYIYLDKPYEVRRDPYGR